MLSSLRTAGTLVLLTFFLTPRLSSQAQSVTTLTAEHLQADFAIMKKAYLALHPGLYRFNDTASMQAAFDDLEKQLQRDMTLAEAYLAFSRFLAQIKCGHTYANFWNQPEVVQQELFHQADKVPFTFRLIDRRMIVTKSASSNERVQAGTEILSINGVAVPAILDSLMTVVKADGSNDGKRIDDLQVTGIGEYEAFDVYYPLFFPVEEDGFAFEALDLASMTRFTVTEAALTRNQRRDRLERRYGPQPTTNDDLWHFEILDAKTALLKLGTFVTWKMEMDWKTFLTTAFEEMDRAGIEHLILDIRGNEGGADDVNTVLLRYLIAQPVPLPGRKELLRYQTVPPDLNAYLDTWDDSFRNRGGRVTEAGDGFYTWTNARTEGRTIQPGKRAFQGQIYLLMGPANSSATFFLASVLKTYPRATLVGQETGGNRRGTTGGQLFFLRLPHSTIEMDLPLIGYYPLTDQPDQGILPDVYVEPRVEDAINGVDAELEAAKQRIADGG